MNRLTRLSLRVSRVLDQVAGWAVVATMVLVVGNVLLRLLGRPMGGTYEWVGFLTALAIGLSLAYCGAQGGHVAITMLVDKLPPKVQDSIDMITGTVVLLFLAMTSWEIAAYATTMYVSGEVAATTKAPIYPFIYIISIGFLGFCLVMAGVVAESVRKVAGK